MKTAQLSCSLRANVGKKDAAALRNAEMVPCVLYGQGEQTHFAVKRNDIEKIVFSPDVFQVELEIEGKKANTWDGRNVDEKNYPPGHLNPINVKSIKRSINIDTRFRPDYYTSKSTDFTLTLPERLNKVVSMRLSSIEIPMSFYALSESLGNTTFTITLDDTNPQYEPNIFIIKIPPGNYEDRWIDSTKAAYIESAVNSALDRVGLGPAGSFKPKDASGKDVPIPCIRFTVDPVSGRSVFALSYSQSSNVPDPKDFPVEIKINFNVNNNGVPDNSTPLLFRLGWQLGFRSGEYNIKSEDGTTDLSGGSIISEGICFVV